MFTFYVYVFMYLGLYLKKVVSNRKLLRGLNKLKKGR